MNKILLTLIAMLVMGIAIYAVSNTSKTPDIAATPTNAPTTPTYIDVEIKLDVKGRDISGKLVFEFPSMERCQAESGNQKSFVQEYNETCNESRGCKSVQVGSCSSFVDDKYLSMLNKQFKGSHYMHISDTQTSDERGVLAFWGLSDEEATALCDASRKDHYDESILTECL